METQEQIWAILHEARLSEKTLYSFASLCAGRVYNRISNLDRVGALKKAIETAKNGDLTQLAEARQKSHRFIRKLAVTKPAKPLLRAAQAARGCAKETGLEAAISSAWLASEAADNAEDEAIWQLNLLNTLVP